VIELVGQSEEGEVGEDVGLEEGAPSHPMDSLRTFVMRLADRNLEPVVSLVGVAGVVQVVGRLGRKFAQGHTHHAG
jgi:hypothetical protein